MSDSKRQAKIPFNEGLLRMISDHEIYLKEDYISLEKINQHLLNHAGINKAFWPGLRANTLRLIKTREKRIQFLRRRLIIC